MKFRHKLLLFGLAVASLAALGVFVAGGALIRRSVSDRVTERLAQEARLLAGSLSRDRSLLPDPETLDATGPEKGWPPAEVFARSTGEALGLRVTIISVKGVVLGDSALEENDVLRLENHAARPEIVAARASGIGASEQHSATVNDDLLYMAQRIDREGRLAGFVRLAVPVSEVKRTTGNYSLELGLFSFIALIAVAVIGYAAAKRFSRPLEQMSRTADAVAAGRRDLEVEYSSSDEIGDLGAALNRMTRALSDQIAALSAEKKLLDTILGGMSEGILVVGEDRRVLLCNSALRDLLGMRIADPAGRGLMEIVRDQAVIRGFDTALQRGERFREVVATALGSGKTFEVTVAPLTDPDGRQIGAIGLFFDVTRLTALESVRREFVADVSHELRTPLTSIKAFVETLLAGGLEDADNNRRFLEIIKKHSDRMEAILDDLTDLSLIETGAVVLQKERVDLAPMVVDLLDSLRPKASALQVSLASEISPGTAVSADRRRLEQVLVNLVDNAIKFNRPGGTVTVRAESPELDEPAGPAQANGIVRIEVEDTGIGIPESALGRVFNRFYRVDRVRSREMGGTGLGLSIVKHLVRLHGGTVTIESQVGKGSRFVLEFPPASA